MSRVISFVNLSTVVSDAELKTAVAAMQTQVVRDFAPTWRITAPILIVVAKGKESGEIIYVQDTSDQADALGYHELSQKDAPVGFVFAKSCQDDGVAWSSCASHELLEQIIDPWVNATFLGTIKGADGKTVAAALAYETCDPVEGDTYQINGVAMSNFITPFWGTPGLPAGTKYDFLGKLTAPFAMTSGGYIAYTTDMATWQQVFGEHAKSIDNRYYRPGRDKRIINLAAANAKAAKLITRPYREDLRKRLSQRAIELKETGDWKTCDLIREARNAIE